MVKEVVCKYRPRVKQSVNLLNLEAGVLGVCSVCARCVLGVLALGRVVAGRFWCSYAWVSLTPTAPVRPRAPVFCTRVRVRARSERACAGGCAGGCVRLCVRAGAPVCVLIGGVVVCVRGVAV